MTPQKPMEQRAPAADAAGALFYSFLLDLLLQSVKLWGREEFSQSNAQPVTNHFDGEQFGIMAFSVEKIFDAGGWQGGQGSQLIDGDFSLPAELQNPVSDDGNGIHAQPSFVIFGPIIANPD